MRRRSPLVRLLAAIALLSSFQLDVVAQLAFESHEGTAYRAPTVHSVTSAPAPDTQGHAPGTPHACHCAHAHLFFAAAVAPTAMPVPLRDSCSSQLTRPNSFALVPRTRPPIA